MYKFLRMFARERNKETESQAPASTSTVVVGEVEAIATPVFFEPFEVIEDYLDRASPSRVEPSEESLESTQVLAQSFLIVNRKDGFPLKSRFIDTASVSSVDRLSLVPSAHTTQLFSFQRKPFKKPTTVVLKTAQPKLAQLEALFSSYYQLLAPESVAKTRVVYQDTAVVGVYSEAFLSFKAIGDEKITEDLLSLHARSLARILIAAYIFEEDDLHRFNFSLTQRIDFDGSMWPLMYRLKGKRFGTWTAPEDAFVFNEEDIRHFPNLRNQRPFYWPTQYHHIPLRNDFTREENACFAALENNPVFVDEKFKVLLKFVLLPLEQFDRLIDLFVERRDFKEPLSMDVLLARLEKRQAELRAILLGMPEFQEFLCQNAEKVLREFTEELEGQNRLYKGEAYVKQRVSILTFREAFQGVVAEIRQQPRCLAV